MEKRKWYAVSMTTALYVDYCSRYPATQQQEREESYPINWNDFGLFLPCQRSSFLVESVVKDFYSTPNCKQRQAKKRVKVRLFSIGVSVAKKFEDVREREPRNFSNLHIFCPARKGPFVCKQHRTGVLLSGSRLCLFDGRRTWAGGSHRSRLGLSF